MFTKPKKRLGQNFLIDKNIREKILKSCALRPEDIVLEIGAGRGELTAILIKNAKKVIAVEIDKELCQILEDKFSGAANFQLLKGDILKIDLSRYKKLVVAANIPYYISSPIIAHLLKYRKSIKNVFLTVQKEVAARISARPGSKDYGALSCFVQLYCAPRVIFTIKNNSFWPAPKVDSAFIELAIRPTPKVKVKNAEGFLRFIRGIFSQRRKMLINSLPRGAKDGPVFLKLLGKTASKRAEELSLEEFARLYNYLHP